MNSPQPNKQPEASGTDVSGLPYPVEIQGQLQEAVRLLQAGDPTRFKEITRQLSEHGNLSPNLVAQLQDLMQKGKQYASASATPTVQPAVSVSQTIAGVTSGAGPSSDTKGDQSTAGLVKGSGNPMWNTIDPSAYSVVSSDGLNTPVAWNVAQQGRPTLTGGIVGGRAAGTPAVVARLGDDPAMLTADNPGTRRKNTLGEQSMRRSIQELVSSIDPNVKVDSAVEDLLLEIADEFIDSATNFACRLAKHRGGDTLEVRDLQLHLERNHNIRIPGFVSDETRFSMAQSIVAAAGQAAPAKKGGQGTHMTLRSQRLAQVAQSKREAGKM